MKVGRNSALVKPDQECPLYVQKWDEDFVPTWWYPVPSRIAKLAPNYSALCFHGCPDPGTYMHIWWTCPVVQAFWKAIFTLASRMFELQVPPELSTALLNLRPDILMHKQFKLMIQILPAAKQTIVKAWKSPSLAVAEVTQSKPHTDTHKNGSYRQQSDF